MRQFPVIVKLLARRAVRQRASAALQVFLSGKVRHHPREGPAKKKAGIRALENHLVGGIVEAL
jgi:hypothetical protein